jgi:hypothetical protein
MRKLLAPAKVEGKDNILHFKRWHCRFHREQVVKSFKNHPFLTLFGERKTNG